jgi:hypothetical protein
MEKQKKPDKQLNRDIHRQINEERFPVSKMTKDSRKDAEKAQQEFGTEPLSDNVNENNSKRSQ